MQGYGGHAYFDLGCLDTKKSLQSISSARLVHVNILRFPSPPGPNHVRSCELALGVSLAVSYCSRCRVIHFPCAASRSGEYYALLVPYQVPPPQDAECSAREHSRGSLLPACDCRPSETGYGTIPVTSLLWVPPALPPHPTPSLSFSASYSFSLTNT